MPLQTLYYTVILTSQQTANPPSVPYNFNPRSVILALALWLNGSLESFSLRTFAVAFSTYPLLSFFHPKLAPF